MRVLLFLLSCSGIVFSAPPAPLSVEHWVYDIRTVGKWITPRQGGTAARGDPSESEGAKHTARVRATGELAVLVRVTFDQPLYITSVVHAPLPGGRAPLGVGDADLTGLFDLVCSVGGDVGPRRRNRRVRMLPIHAVAGRRPVFPWKALLGFDEFRNGRRQWGISRSKRSGQPVNTLTAVAVLGGAVGNASHGADFRDDADSLGLGFNACALHLNLGRRSGGAIGARSGRSANETTNQTVNETAETLVETAETIEREHNSTASGPTRAENATPRVSPSLTWPDDLHVSNFHGQAAPGIISLREQPEAVRAIDIVRGVMGDQPNPDVQQGRHWCKPRKLNKTRASHGRGAAASTGGAVDAGLDEDTDTESSAVGLENRGKGVISHNGEFISALEVNTLLQHETSVQGGMVKDIVEGAVMTDIKPAMVQETYDVGYTSGDQVAGSLGPAVGGEVPTDVANMLDVALTYNLTNLLTDSITAAVAPRLSNSIFEALGASSVVKVVCV